MTRTAGLLACLALAAAAQSDSGWELPECNGSTHVSALVLSKLSYAIMLCDEVDEVARAPDRIELPLKSSERKSLDRARKSLAKGDYEKVGTMVRNFVRRNPANYDALILGAEALHRDGKDEEAVAMVRDALIGNRRSPEAWALLEKIAAKSGRRVVRPRMEPRGWVKPPNKEGDIEVGHADADKDEDAPWMFYGPVRAVFRYEERYKEFFPKAREYFFSFTEQLHAVSAVIRHADIMAKKKEKIAADVTRLMEERTRGTIVPFVFFAMYPEVLPAKPEPGFETLRPNLEEYFDRHIVVDGSS